MVNFTGRKTPSTQCALIGSQLQVGCKICCKFSSGNTERKISDFQSEADYMNIIWIFQYWFNLVHGQTGSGQTLRKIYTSHQSQKCKVVIDIKILIFLQNIRNCWPVAFLRSLVISKPPDTDGIGENQEAHMALASMNKYTCERCLAWEYGRYPHFLEIFKTNVRFWLTDCISFLQDSG